MDIYNNKFTNSHSGVFSDYGKSEMFFKYFDDIISRKLVIETINEKQEEVDYEYTIDESKIPDGLKKLIDKYISKDKSFGDAQKDITGNFIYNFQRYIYAKHGATLFDTNKDVFNRNLIDIINKECEALEKSNFFDDKVDISKLLGKNEEFLVSKACFNCLPSRFLTKILEDKPDTIALINTRKIDLNFIQNKIEKINKQDDKTKNINEPDDFLVILKNMDPIKDIDDILNNNNTENLVKNNTENLVQMKYLLQPAHFYPIKQDGKTVKDANATPYWDGSRTIAFPNFYNPRYTHNGFDFSDTGTVATNGRVENSDLGYIFYIAGLMDNIDKTKRDFNLSSYILDHKTREDIIKMTSFISNNKGTIDKILGIKIDVTKNENELAFGLPKISIKRDYTNKDLQQGTQNINIDFVCMLEEDINNGRVKNVFSDSVTDISKAVEWIGKNRETIFSNPNNSGSIYSCAQGMSRSNLTGTIINSIKYVEGVRRDLIKDDEISAQLETSDKTPDLIIFDLLLKRLNNSGMELSFIHSVTSPDHNAAISAIVAGPNKKAPDYIQNAVNKDKDYDADTKIVDAYRNVQSNLKKEISNIYRGISKMESFVVSDFNHEKFKENLVDRKIEQDVINILKGQKNLKPDSKWRDILGRVKRLSIQKRKILGVDDSDNGPPKR